MKFLVTGASGFIGNYVVTELLKRDHQVIAVGRNKGRAESQEWYSKVRFVECDIINLTGSDVRSFGEIDRMIHLAWRGLPNYKSLYHFEEVLMEQYQFLKLCVQSGLRDITITGTCFEYGMREGALSTKMVAEPNNPYGLAKDCLRRFLVELQKVNSFNLKWLRLFYMYGKGQSEKSILSQLEKALVNGEKEFNMSGGMQLRDYLPVERVAEMIVDHSENEKENGIYNCCSGKPISIRQLVNDYLQKQQKQIKLNYGYYPYPDYEPMEFWGECD